MTVLLFFIIGYLLGSFPTAYFVVKKFAGKDIRKEETGNVGAMNTARITGKWYLFLLVIAGDALKGLIGVMLPRLFYLHGPDLRFAVTSAAFGIVLGHCYSLYFKLKDGKFAGGKAIACYLGILGGVSLTHLLAPGLAVLFLSILVSGNLFFGQWMGNLSLPFIGYFLMPDYFLMTILCAIPVFIKQWPRVIPMLQGKEPKWYFRKKKKL